MTERISGDPTGKGSFLVESATTPGLSWPVEFVAEGVRWCACPAFQRAQRCRHVEAVEAAVEAEWRRALASTPESRAAAALRLQVLAEVFDR